MIKSEEKPAVIDPLQQGIVRLVQITDCHVFADSGEGLRGVDTRQSLAAVSAAIRRDQFRIDALLATGDLSQDGSAESYRHLASRFDQFARPVFWLPGNHDNCNTMTTHFQGDHIHADKSIRVGEWLIVMLDSTIENEVHGRVSDAQLNFLDSQLQQHPDAHALVCLHHQALDIGSRWLDQKGLHDSEGLRAVIGRHINVRGVLWGHVHQEFQQRIDNIEWMSTPSSCVQFRPGSAEFATDDKAPGYRSLNLHADGKIETEVHRVDLDDPGCED